MTTSKLTRICPWLFIFALLFGVPKLLDAQYRESGRVGLSQPDKAPTITSIGGPPVVAESKSYWREGGIVTAVAGVVMVNFIVDGFGEKDSAPSIPERLIGSALVAIVFFVPGALIGGLIPKK